MNFRWKVQIKTTNYYTYIITRPTTLKQALLMLDHVCVCVCVCPGSGEETGNDRANEREAGGGGGCCLYSRLYLAKKHDTFW